MSLTFCRDSMCAINSRKSGQVAVACISHMKYRVAQLRCHRSLNGAAYIKFPMSRGTVFHNRSHFARHLAATLNLFSLGGREL